MPTMLTARFEGPRRRRSVRRTVSRRVLLFALPAVAFYVFVVIVPTIQGAGFAFTNWDGLSKEFRFVGFENIAEVLTDETSFRALMNTIVIAVAFTVIQNIIGLGLALGLSSRIRSRNFLKVLFFAPVVMTPVVVAYLWQYMLAPNGPLNTVLRGVGLGQFAVAWLGDPIWALVSIIALLIWQFSGYSMVIFIAGLQAIPKDVLEASAVDGAGPVRNFVSIILPLLAPATTINLMLSLIGSLKVFDQVWVLTGGGPGGSTHTLTTLMFRQAFTYGDYGQGVAMGLVLLVIVTLISIAQYRVLLNRELKS